MRIIKFSKWLLPIALCLSLSGWIGFKLWLGSQPEDFRQQVDELSTADFWRHVWQQLVPPKKPDLGDWQRRDYDGRGHSPWVMRSSLDGQPRMLNVALAPKIWLSYSLERAAPYQLWQGKLDFGGPVFGGNQGDQPKSSGAAWFQNTDTGWRIAGEKSKVGFEGYRLNGDGKSIELLFRIESASGTVHLQETPALENGKFIRQIQVLANPAGLATEVWHAESWQPVARGVTLELTLGTPKLSLDKLAAAQPSSEAQALVLSNNCLTCHNDKETVVGPSWQAIAERYGAMTDAREHLMSSMAKGSRGKWGEVSMPAQPQLNPLQRRTLANHILAHRSEPDEIPAPVAALRERFDHTYDAIAPRHKQTLHPALQKTSLLPAGFTPAVGGLAQDDKGNLYVSTWDRDGAVYRISNWENGSPEVTRIAEGLHEPLGLAAAEGKLYVMQKQEVTELVDEDGDGLIDFYRVVNGDWPASANFHEFGFGLASDGNDLYGSLSVCVLVGGKSCANPLPGRGSVFRVDRTTGEFETVATGFRTPNGLGLNAEGELFVTDNQGDWMPASKLNYVERGGFYGFGDYQNVSPPALWLPQNEIGNSPTEPVFLRSGPYAGQVLFGDIYNGGLKRGFLEKVNGRYQGAAFHFSGGLAGPVNRLLQTTAGLVAGQIGNPGNWGEPGKPWYGLDLLRWNNTVAFEPLAVRATAKGFAIEFSGALAQGISPDGLVRAQHWFYFASPMYGGPKYDLQPLKTTRARLSEDRTTLFIDTPDRQSGRVIYLEFEQSIRSSQGEALWADQAWVTFHNAPASTPENKTAANESHNQLTQSETHAGWRLLFNGKNFSGWHNHNAAGMPVRGWQIENGAMKMVRDTSFARFVLNIVNPFTKTPLVDLKTNQQFSNFELSLEWKISAGGNSGIFYLLPPTDDRLAWGEGLEMQVLDNAGHSDGRFPNRGAGALYDLKAPSKDVVKPYGEWNHARVRVQGDHIQHWLNGEKIVDIRRSGKAWEAMLAESKFADEPQHGQAERGHILLQDHGDTVWYRNIKIREF